ncbi:hypothetical protein Q3G72_018747 [Acer saccharum]|nr:hypothetical protein Q3G72_018747 [Acer saccharum]
MLAFRMLISHNLARKIASVLKVLAPSSIFHTFETERKQIAISNTALSVQNFKAAMAVPSALGLEFIIMVEYLSLSGG